MTEEISDYVEIEKLISWLDIDPRFAPVWLNWIFFRPFAFCPSLTSAVRELGRIDYNRAMVNADKPLKAFADEPEFGGTFRQERLTAEQIKFATGIQRNAGQLRPVRLDKALLTIYALNIALREKNKPHVKPKFFECL